MDVWPDPVAIPLPGVELPTACAPRPPRRYASLCPPGKSGTNQAARQRMNSVVAKTGAAPGGRP